MGCFNHKCNFSQLPAKAGDRIVVFVGVRKTAKALDADSFAPGSSFTPISVPIRGSYNDYGGIEEVDRTAGVEALENYFSMGVEEIVEVAERVSCDCKDQVEEEYRKIKKVLNSVESSVWKKYDLEFSYIMEHEAIFDNMVAMNDKKIRDVKYWRIPHEVIESLGYTKNVIGKDGMYDIIVWTHPTLPGLKENCYVWKTEDFDNYSKLTETIASFCAYVGCDVPEQYEKSYCETCFLEGVEKVKNSKFPFVGDNYDNYSYLRHAPRGLFSLREGHGLNEFLLISLGDDNKHMDIRYMREVIEVGLLYDALRMLEMTWGNTNYYGQDIDYGRHISFLKNCLALAEEKDKEWKEMCGDEE